MEGAGSAAQRGNQGDTSALPGLPPSLQTRATPPKDDASARSLGIQSRGSRENRLEMFYLRTTGQTIAKRRLLLFSVLNIK